MSTITFVTTSQTNPPFTFSGSMAATGNGQVLKGINVITGFSDAGFTLVNVYSLFLNPALTHVVGGSFNIFAPLYVIANAQGAVTVTSLYGILVDAPSVNITATTAYGLYVGSQTVGTTNYAIYTNTGAVRLGDAVTIVGLLTAQAGLTLTGTLTMATAVSILVPGATSFSIRNSANNADNIITTDAGLVTLRNTLTITAGGLTVSGGSISASGISATFGQTTVIDNSTVGLSIQRTAAVARLYELGVQADGSLLIYDSTGAGNRLSIYTTGAADFHNNAVAMGALTATTAVIGTDPGGTDALRVQAKARIGATEVDGSGTVAVLISTSGSGIGNGVQLQDSAGNLLSLFRTTTAGQIGMQAYDQTKLALAQVTRGANDSGGAGFALLRVPN